jgi:hypothetical protein
VAYRANTLLDEDGVGTSTPDDQYPGDLDARHARLIRWFEEAERASIDMRDEGNRARDYYSGLQWTAAEQKALRARGQPELTINYISRKVELLCGLERKARTDPKAFSRTPTEDERADAATQALRYVADDNNLPVIRSAVYQNMLIEGVGGVNIGLTDDGRGGADVTLKHVSWERIWFDPHSRAADFADARYLGLVIWSDKDQLLDTYPGAEEVIEDTFGQHSGAFTDRPENVAWADSRRERVRVVQCHWVEQSVWWTATFSRSGFLATPQRSRFLDRHGKSACSLVLQSAFIDRENRRYGVVRDLFSLQDELNKRRSKALHLLSVARVITEAGAVADEDKARREVAKPDGFVVVNPGMRFDVEPGGDLATGQFELLKHATEEMQASGPNASMSGNDPRELSGRAILAQQAGGAAQNEPLADSLRMWSRRIYEIAWMAVRQSWTAGKWVRVTDDLGSTRWVGINTPETVRDKLAAMPDQQRAAVMQQMQLQPDDPRLDQVIGKTNDISDLDVDIEIEEGIDVPALQAEQFQTLVQLAGIQPGLIPGDVLIAASGLKNKDMLLERMKEHAQQQAQQQAQQAPLMQRHAEATVAGLEAKAAADQALAAERQHAVVHGIHDIHSEFAAPPYGSPFAAPPDAPSAPGTVMPPEIQALHDHADLRSAHATAAATEAKAVDARHAAMLKIAQMNQIHHQMKHPPAKGSEQ